MCGLLAYVGHGAGGSGCSDAVVAGLECLHHRGPDETGVVVGEEIVFGHKRLAVIDVASSQEPLSYPPAGPGAGRFLVVFNGEIYNYPELRQELISDYGAQFATAGDTEVLVAAYMHWGESVLERIRGMYAFVLWDSDHHRAFVARDPFGVKPLYYASVGEGMGFGSEKKALLALMSDDNELDGVSLSHYLTLQYVPEPATLHRQIRCLPAGACATYTPGEGLKIRRYYQPMFCPIAHTDPVMLYRRILDTLRESVRLHLRSDVPVGAFLSGGIDSTAVVALAREVNPAITAFTVGYDVPAYSEIALAEASARELDVAIVVTTIGPHDMMAALPEIMWHLDDPVADPSVVPLYFLAKTAAEHVTVVLSGEGADELFGGYRIYREPSSLAALQRLPLKLQRGIRTLASAIPDGVRGKSFLQRGTTPLRSRYYGNARIFTEQEKRRLLRHYDPNVTYTDVTASLYGEAAHLDDSTAMQYIDMCTWLRGDILVKADRMSMAHSLELRVPFLDRAVFEVAATIPVELKVPRRSQATKVALRRALEGVVPEAVLHRRKLGFPTPTRVWLATDMYDWADDIIATSGAGGILDLPYIRSLLADHRRGPADHSRKIWTALAFCTWYAIFIGQTLIPAASHAIRNGRRP